MIQKRYLFLVLALVLFSLAPSVSSVGEVTFCCEKTDYGAWCMNEPEEVCNENFRMSPTACESTSFCKEGTCILTSTGECRDDTSQRSCDERKGYWIAEEAEDIPQCSLGCCFLGGENQFVTQTMCKSLAQNLSLVVDFRTDITSEIECIAATTSDTRGACVYSEDFTKTCVMNTQQECDSLAATHADAEFHRDFLCSADELETVCGATGKTTCVDGKDEAYFVDSCGNVANIYDSRKLTNKEYWTKITPKDESCGAGGANSGSVECGNCDYFYGSTCKAYDRSEDNTPPESGDYICRDLGCFYQGEEYQHGETWCATVSNEDIVSEYATIDINQPGTEHNRLVCYNGEVTVEPCSAFRSEVCLQSEVNDFKTAGCVANRWQDCLTQTDPDDCTNTDHRDCNWVLTQIDMDGKESHSCLPKYSPGFDFWSDSTEAADLCSIASVECVAKFEKSPLFESVWDCVENCHCCVDDDNHEGCTGDETGGLPYEIGGVCASLGDCGVKVNYQGIEGDDYDESPFTCNGDDCSFEDNVMNWIRASIKRVIGQR